jgi:hypothetical protein
MSEMQTTTFGGVWSQDLSPNCPRVDVGPKAYWIYRDRTRKVIRFCVCRPIILRTMRRATVWYVMDMDTGTIAAKTSKTGYTDQREAMDVARDYRDRYGAYVRSAF